MKKIFKALLVGVGTVALFLGLLGIFLPILPTTPFLLLTAYCYGRSSERFYQWLLNNRWFGVYLKNYREGRGIPLRKKILTLALLWLTISSTALLVLSVWWGRLLLFGIAVAVTIHIFGIKTYRAPEVNHEPDKLYWPDATKLDLE